MTYATTTDDVKSRNLEREATLFLFKHGLGKSGRPLEERSTSGWIVPQPFGGQPESSRKSIWRRKSS